MTYLIGQELRDAREAAGMSAEDLASQAGCSTYSVYYWERQNDVSRPTAKVPRKIARVLGAERDATIRRLRSEGVPAKDIAARFGVTDSRVYQIAPMGKRNGDPIGHLCEGVRPVVAPDAASANGHAPPDDGARIDALHDNFGKFVDEAARRFQAMESSIKTVQNRASRIDDEIIGINGKINNLADKVEKLNHRLDRTRIDADARRIDIDEVSLALANTRASVRDLESTVAGICKSEAKARKRRWLW